MDFQRQDHCDCFDYPVAWCWFRQHCREVHGWDPGDNETPMPSFRREESKSEGVRLSSPDLTPIKSWITDLQAKVNKHIDMTKKPSPNKSLGIKE